MIQIRNGSFETNSSSVHVLVIPKENPIDIPNEVILTGGEWGWSPGIEQDTINYFYQACLDRGPKYVTRFIKFLKKNGVNNIAVDPISWHTTDYKGNPLDEDEYWPDCEGSIDHSGCVPIDELFADEEMLIKFLFGTRSFIETGNDNSDNCPEEEGYDKNKFDVFEKGN